jgi:hypothetical protein
MKKHDESFLEAKARAKQGQRGKKAESVVQDMLKERQAAGILEFIRLPDSRSAGRPLPAQPCDYIVFHEGNSVALEVKEISKGSRLPRKSFPQLPRMQQLGKVGVILLLWVYLKETNEWRSLDVLGMELEDKSWNALDPCLSYSIDLDEVFPEAKA